MKKIGETKLQDKEYVKGLDKELPYTA